MELNGPTVTFHNATHFCDPRHHRPLASTHERRARCAGRHPSHPASKGYTCEKALRLDLYQNGRGERLTSPQRRRPDGTYEAIDWDTAIREVAARFAAVRDTYGGEAIVYYGGGGQGNHLGGTYGSATRGALGVRFRSNAIAQEKTGEMLVMGKMFGTPLRVTSSSARWRSSPARTLGSATGSLTPVSPRTSSRRAKTATHGPGPRGITPYPRGSSWCNSGQDWR